MRSKSYQGPHLHIAQATCFSTCGAINSFKVSASKHRSNLPNPKTASQKISRVVENDFKKHTNGNKNDVCNFEIPKICPFRIQETPNKLCLRSTFSLFLQEKEMKTELARGNSFGLLSSTMKMSHNTHLLSARVSNVGSIPTCCRNSSARKLTRRLLKFSPPR